MKLILNLLFCLVMIPLVAEKIGPVEYQLPPQVAGQWEIGNKLENEKSVTVIYIPKGTSRQSTKEFFGVNANRYPSDLDNTLSFKASLAKQYPHMQVDVDILERGKDNLLYEWVAKEQGKEKIHGLGRVFSIGGGTVVLGYQTENIADVARARLDWLPTLKQAKVRQ